MKVVIFTSKRVVTLYFGFIPKKSRKCDWLGFESGSKNVSSLLRVELGKVWEEKNGAFEERGKVNGFMP